MSEWEADQIQIKHLEVFANHGVFPEENRLGQKFIINASFDVSVREAGLKDDLSKSVDYGEVSHFMSRFMKEHTFQLIEAAAERLARATLLQFPSIAKINLEIQKPWAPVGLPLEAVSVKIVRGWHRAYVAAGSNLGDREAYLRQGWKALEREEGCTVERVSQIIATKPYGVKNQPDFLNCAAEIRTLLTPAELLELLHQAEREAGRERKLHWGPRTLDLDILFYDDLVVDQKDLQIPHPDLQNRAFVLHPLAELVPYLRHPLFGKTVLQMKKELDRKD